MTAKLRPYVIKQGDFLAKLGYVHGFDPDEIWNHEKNADLKNKRRTPDILYPGDILYLPLKRQAGLEATSQGDNSYRAQVPTTQVRLQLEDEDGPLAGVTCTLRGVPGIEQDSEVSADANGVLLVEIPLTCKTFEVYIEDENEILEVQLGHLNPVAEHNGKVQRLQSMGYLSPYDSTAIDERHVTGALTALGADEEATEAALIKGHGC